ncbi:MAG: hypothetical protein WCG47_09605 [Dermatophilaceae bacterium]
MSLPMQRGYAVRLHRATLRAAPAYRVVTGTPGGVRRAVGGSS